MKIASLLAALAIICVLYARQHQSLATAEQAAAADAGAVLAPGAPSTHSVYKRALDSAQAVKDKVDTQQAEHVAAAL